MTASCRLVLKKIIKDNKIAFIRHLPLVLEPTPSCYHGDCSKCADNSVVRHNGVSDNLRNYFMFLAFKKFHNLNINKNDKVLLLEILKLKLNVASVEQMDYTLIFRK